MSDDGRPLHIGFLAPELHHEHGGMRELERELSGALAMTDRVTVFAAEEFGAASSDVKPLLTRDLRATRDRLRNERVDVWFAANAAHAALAPWLDAPLVPFCNGNDVLNPWLYFARPWVDRLEERRVVWRFRDWLDRSLRQYDLRRGLLRAPSIVANSRNTASLVENLHRAVADRITVIEPGVADDFFQPRADGGSGGALRLLTVSRLERWTARKNVDGVLQALRLLPGDVPFHYTIVGDGDDRPRLEALAAELELDATVTFRGALPRESLKTCYREADLFVLASRARPHDVEGFGIVYLEAAAAGLPSLCSAEGGATDAVADGVSGVVIPRSTPETIAEGILRFVRERDRISAERTRAFAEQFRWPIVAQRLRRTLLAAAGPHAPARAA